jgi:predicted nucleic acid-binding protein
MNYILDSSAIIDILRGKGAAEGFISDHIDDSFSTSCVCEAEVAEGVYRETKENIPMRRQQMKKVFASFHRVLPFDSDQADIVGKIRAELGKAGQLIDDLDILIAAAAISSQSAVVTKNPRHFIRIKNLEVISV